MKVEHALRLLPNLEVLGPLRARLLSISRADERSRWASAGPYLTVGKRAVEAAALREGIDPLIEQVTAHLRLLFRSVVDAIEAEEAGDTPKAIAALQRAGVFEVRAGRLKQAEAWYDAALALASELSDRGAELELLRLRGALGLMLGRYGAAARDCQRSLVLAEGEFNDGAVIAACEELGNIHRGMGESAGAQAWYERGLSLNGTHGVRSGWLLLRLGDLARERGDLLAATELLDRAREYMRAGADAAGMAQTLSAQGQVQIAQGHHAAALGAYREALVWARQGPEPANLEIEIRIRLSDLALESGRWLEAEADLRQAEQAALAHGLAPALVKIYTLLGRLSGRGGEETGFVFFEQALELCNALELDALIEADVCVAYGQFHAALGNVDLSRAYLERAAETYQARNQTVGAERVHRELSRLAPADATYS
ncbi:MAG TPA: tetratricopeptide repeat protein [Gemmatimonadales bacterium]